MAARGALNLQNSGGFPSLRRTSNSKRHRRPHTDSWRVSTTYGRTYTAHRARKVLRFLRFNSAACGPQFAPSFASANTNDWRQVPLFWTPNKVTLLRVAVGFTAVSLFGQSAWLNLLAVALTVTSIGLDALDGYLARRRRLATPIGAQVDILGDRMIENMYFTYFAVAGLVSLWLPMLFFARGAATDFLRGLALKAGHSGWGANAMLHTWWGRALVSSRWSRAAYAALKCVCFCYLGLELALTRGPVAVVGPLTLDAHDAIRAGAQMLTWITAGFCVVRAAPVLVEGWKFFAGNIAGTRGTRNQPGRAQ